jgi:hypothetical protein
MSWGCHPKRGLSLSIPRPMRNAKMSANLHLGLLLLRNIWPGRCDERAFEISAYTGCVRLRGLTRRMQDP